MRNRSNKRKWQWQDFAIKVQTLFFCFWLLTPSFSDRLSSLPNCLSKVETMESEAEQGVNGKKTGYRLQPWTTARLCFWQREASYHKERSVAAVKVRDMLRLEKISDVKETDDCGCRLTFQEKELQDTSSPNRFILMFYGLVSFWFNDNNVSQQVKIE